MGSSRSQHHAVEVQETPENYIASIRLDDIDPDSINVSGFGNTLTITGELRKEWHVDGDENRWILRARDFGAFERSLTLATSVDSDAASTRIDGGVLTVTLPKIGENGSRLEPELKGSRRV